MGVLSEGMILAAEKEDGHAVLVINDDVKVGSVIK